MNREDPYIELAGRYDWMFDDNPRRTDFFRNLFYRHGTKRILDCACGTGNDLVMFHSLGLETVGSDLSDAMLAQARMKTEGLNIPLKKSDFRRLQVAFDDPFDAVVCLGNAINELLEDKETMQALKSMRSVMKEEGILILDQGQTDRFMQKPPRFVPVLNDRDRSRLFWIEYTEDIETVHIFDFIHSATTSDFAYTSVQIRIRLLDGWERILKKARFSKRWYYGDWKATPYDRTSSSRLIIVAKI